MILQTERLVIKEATLDDGAFFFRLLNSPNWIEFIGDRGINSEEDAIQYIQESLIESYVNLGFGLFKMILRENNKPIGICGFLKRDYLDHPDIGFAILPKYERMGYTLEAAHSLKDYGENQLGLNPILAITTSKNVGSQQLLNKIGLKYIKIVKPSQDGEDLMLYSSKGQKAG